MVVSVCIDDGDFCVGKVVPCLEHRLVFDEKF